MARGGRKKKRKERKKRGKKREKRGRIGCAVVVASSIFGLWPVDRTDRFFISPKERGGAGRGGRSGCEHRMRRFFARFFPPSLPSFFLSFLSLCPPLCLSPFPPSRSFSPVEKCITGRVERPPKKRRNVRGIVEPRSSTCPFPPPQKKNETSGRFEGARG